MFKLRLLIVVLAVACVCGVQVNAQSTPVRRLRVAVLDFGEAETGQRVSESIASALGARQQGDEKASAQISVIDRDLSRLAARGAGYAGSLNMSLSEARDLGAAIGCDFLITGEAQTLRRAPADAPAYIEAYASVFIISARTGRLVAWQHPSFAAATHERATGALVGEIQNRARTRYGAMILEAQLKEETERRASLEQTDERVVFEDLSGDDEEAATSRGVRAPRPYRRLQPVYPVEAARAEVEATVDVLLDIDAGGEVNRVEVTRWAGYGLDESVVSTVRRLHFYPAMRDGSPVPVRVMLRYNFRRPPKSAKQTQ